MYELQKLCDDVPRFSNEVARQIFKDEFGTNWEDVYEDLIPDPIAAASIGQVYKAKIKATGEIVAIKVQRPGILETVSLDLCLLRRMAELIQSTKYFRSDLVSILDEWAGRFYEEMNYV